MRCMKSLPCQEAGSAGAQGDFLAECREIALLSASGAQAGAEEHKPSAPVHSP